MNLESVLLALRQKYNCSEPVYLSNFFKPNGEKWLYDKLKQLHQPVYENNYRLLLIQDCIEVYNFADLPGLITTTIQKYASQLDISNCFILLVTGNQNITQELEKARTLYSTDTWSIQHHLVDSLPVSAESNSKQDTFCVLPWIHLYVGTDGNILPCCQADHQFSMGNINSQSVDDIVKSSTFNQLRANMIAGKRSKECARCYQQEDSGLRSGRLEHNAKWPDLKIADLDPKGTIDKFEPVYFDIRLNNICNLKCRMCSGYFSSAIAQEEAELFGDASSVKSSLRNKQRKFGLEEILSYLPTAEKIYFAGGEPLLASEHYEILQTLIDHGNTDLEISYNTNFTTLQYQKKSVLDLWKHFSNVKVGASLDAMGKVAEYVRHGTDWKTIESNLNLVKTHCSHVNFTVTSTVGLLNVSSLIELQKQWHTSGMLDLSKFSLSIMISPEHLTLCVLPETHKQRLEQQIKHHIVWCERNSAPNLATQWTDVLAYMRSRDDSHQLAEFRRLTNLMDTHRGESLSESVPELSNLL
jgi:radical SAM protein with 4Fe4S-binding SPASM domain